MTKFKNSAAAGLVMMLGGAFADSAAAYDTNSIASLNDTTVNLSNFGESAAVPKQPAAKSCVMNVTQYFTNDNLASINQTLGKIKHWVSENSFDSDDFIEDYLGEAEEIEGSGVKQATYDTYNNLASYHQVFKAGTPIGLTYLQSDPVAVVGAIYAYTDYSQQLKGVLADMGYTEQLNQLKAMEPTIKKLRGIAENTEALMVQQVMQKCPMAMTLQQ